MNCFFCIYWDDHRIHLLYFINGADCIEWCLSVKPTLHFFLFVSGLVVMYSLFTHCCFWFARICLEFKKKINVVRDMVEMFLSFDVLVQLWYQDYACLKNDSKTNLSFLLSERTCEKYWHCSVLKYFVEFTMKPSMLVVFFVGKFFNRELIFKFILVLLGYVCVFYRIYLIHLNFQIIACSFLKQYIYYPCNVCRMYSDRSLSL